jgi:hypothetical protein
VLGAVGRSTFGVLVLAALGAVGATVIHGPGRPSLVLPWALVGWLLWGYVQAVRAARQQLRAVVLGHEGEPSGKAPQARAFPTRRGASLKHLASAFVAARRADTITAEMWLARVQRGDLRAWELRVFEAVRTLVCLEHSEVGRAAQLAPLALPTGNDGVDRQLARLMVRAAWEDEVKLSAIEAAMLVGGRPLRDLALLCRVRQGELSNDHPEAAPLSRRVLLRVAEEAKAVGDERLADELVAAIERRGIYR